MTHHNSIAVSGVRLKNYHLQKRLLIPLSLTFLVLITAFVLTSYHISRQDESASMETRYRQFHSIFNSIALQNSQSMEMAAEFIGNQQRFRNAMRYQDREQLLIHADEIFPLIRRTLQVSHFYFRDPQGELLLRVYRPEDLSPGAPRIALQRAMATGHPSSGLEIGRFGTLAQRMVYPWFVNSELIGYIEMGIEIHPLLEQIKEISKSDILVMLNKELLNRELWEISRKERSSSAAWDLIEKSVVSSSTFAVSDHDLRRLYDTSEMKTPFARSLTINDRLYRSGRFPISDASQQEIGHLIMIVDVTERAEVFRTFILRVIGFSLLLSLALFVYALRILKRVSLQLKTSEQLLRQESERLAESNDNLRKEIDDRKQAQQQLQELNLTLEQRVEERTRELARKNLEIEANHKSLESAYQELKEQQATILHQDKMACIGQLAAGIAHDINNPIGFMSHNLVILERYLERFRQFFTLQTSTIERNSDPNLLTAYRKNLSDFAIHAMLAELPVIIKECRDGTSRIDQTVQSLRTFSRNEIPRLELTDLHQCIDSTLAIIRHELDGRITVDRDYGNIPMRQCYPGQINQVFLNLLINAVQAISNEGFIRIKTRLENQSIFISVTDTGCGIPDEVVNKVFEPFFTTKETGVGTGLGLSIVFDIITRHQGTISVSSSVDKGTIFIIRLPVDNDATINGQIPES